MHVGRGNRDDGVPFTADAYPNLVGIPGGLVNPVSLSLAWTTHEDEVRPTRGWRLILVGAHTNKSMLSDFEFTRLVGDISYLIPLWEGAHIIGVRINGGYINGPHRQVPFWQLEELGGDDTLRGFFPHRFLGVSRALGTVEYRARLFAFNFFSLWRVQVDGVAFGEVGRVFISSSQVRDEFGSIPTQSPGLPPTLVSDPDRRLVSHLQYSYGPGLRLALSRALVARFDVGFSNERSGLVYLTFGQTF